MRVLWIDADDSPWTDPNGWRVIEDFGLRVHHCYSVEDAEPLLFRAEFELLLVRAEIDDADALLLKARQFLKNDPRRVVLASSAWSKSEFKSHAKTPSAAHRYARVPMPPEGFLGLVADLFGCSVEELADFTLPAFSAEAASEKAEVAPFSLEDLVAAPSLAPRAEAPKPAPAKRKPSVTQTDVADVEVLRKYLRIKEEQLEISEGERSELSKENERLAKEAHSLQYRLRELEHLESELNRKLQHNEEKSRDQESKHHLYAQEKDRNEKFHLDRIKALELQVGDSNDKYENLRVRVRKDIRKIRENERDLEARLELLRKDSETLLKARDEKVLDLQRKIDALEFDLDQVQDSKVQAQVEAERYLAKLSRVARALHIATGMIEDDHISEEELDELEPVMGGAANAVEPPPPAAPVAESAAADSLAEAAPEASEEGAASADGEGGEALSEELEALANDGEPTQMLSMHNLDEEPESHSG